jgi:hypothetical protein
MLHALSFALSIGCASSEPASPAEAPLDADDAGSPADAGAGAPNECSDTSFDACRYQGSVHTVRQLDAGTVHDPLLDRDNPIVVRAPGDAPGPFPVVVFSHGGELDDRGHLLSQVWGETIASFGYVVIHVGHTVPSRAETRRMCRLASVPIAECTNATFAVDAVARPRDVIAILDDLPRIASLLAADGGPAIDAERIAVAGWSAGSTTGLGLAGSVREISPTVTRFRIVDERPLAFIALSPQGPGFAAYFETETENSWQEIDRPVLVATGDNDINPSNDGLFGIIRREAYEDLPGGGLDQHLLYSHLAEGVGRHGTYNLGDLGSADPDLSRLSLALVSTAAAFLDAELRDDADAIAYLASSQPAVLAGAAHTEWVVK